MALHLEIDLRTALASTMGIMKDYDAAAEQAELIGALVFSPSSSPGGEAALLLDATSVPLVKLLLLACEVCSDCLARAGNSSLSSSFASFGLPLALSLSSPSRAGALSLTLGHLSLRAAGGGRRAPWPRPDGSRTDADTSPRGGTTLARGRTFSG